MATRTVKPSGGDYTTLTSWEAALPATLTEPEIVECDDFDLTDTLAISGVTTSAANYLEVRSASGARHDGRSRTVSGTGFRLKRTTAAGTTLAISANHVRITGIEIEAQSTSSAIQMTGSFASGANDVRIENCVIHDVNTGSGYTINASVANLNLTLRNNVIYGYQRTWDTRNAASALSENNTCWRHAAQLGLVSDSELVCKNTYSGHTGAASEDFWTGSTPPSGNNNASSDTSQATDYTAGVSSVAGSAVFVSVTAGAEDFTLKSGTNALVEAGATLGTVATDIIGTSRPQGSAYDIGAFERIVASGTTVDCTPAIASATGITAQIIQATVLDCTPGVAGAPGVQAQIIEGVVIFCTPGNASAGGISALIESEGEPEPEPEPPPISSPPGGGRGSRSSRAALVVVEYDGKEYRVPLSKLDAFLDARKQEAKAEAKKVTEQATVEIIPAPPKVELKELPAPTAQMPAPLVQQKIIDTNRIMNDIWTGTIGRKVTENAKRRKRTADEDELLLLLL